VIYLKADALQTKIESDALQSEVVLSSYGDFQMDEQKDRARVRVFPPAVPLVVILVGAGLNYLIPIQLGFEIPAPDRYWLGGVVIVSAILGLGLWPVILVRRSGQSENPWKPTTHILQQGPFRFTRNPMYLQMVIGTIGFAILFWNPWILFLTPLCAWCLHHFAIKPEEAYLEGKFGEAYRSYKQNVRRWL
jgi:protein-S-isoprenylcysteine O-methyltransferase Ste14